MTEIHQNSLANSHSLEETPRNPGDRSVGNDAQGRQLLDDRSRDTTAGSVNISFNAHMRLRAYQDQKVQLTDQSTIMPLNSSQDTVSDDVSNKSFNKMRSDDTNVLEGERKEKHSQNNEMPESLNHPETNHFSESITGMLSEVQNNIVQASEPGYRYLVNMLSNYQTTVDNPQQLQEIMRKEEFYLTRRKPFMDSSDFQSYSQVLNQFSNIIARQQFI
ncbi:MAG: hypothetical protein OQL19_20100 [Gammaproteobacteria bacterium]|nr:hypothetical protein [Gammaproteobacteria bacterium]